MIIKLEKKDILYYKKTWKKKFNTFISNLSPEQWDDMANENMEINIKISMKQSRGSSTTLRDILTVGVAKDE